MHNSCPACPRERSERKMPITMQATCPKRGTPGILHELPNKLHRVTPQPAAMLMDMDAPPVAAPQTIPRSAAVRMVVYKVSDCAADSVTGYAGTGAGLFEVMMEHAAYPSCLYRLRTEFDAFLRCAHHNAADEAPSSIEELDAGAGKL